jgi:hypothetical protein
VKVASGYTANTTAKKGKAGDDFQGIFIIETEFHENTSKLLPFIWTKRRMHRKLLKKKARTPPPEEYGPNL